MVKPKRNVSFSQEFFKVYLSDLSSRQLSLPPAFGIQFNGKDEALPKNATLKDGNTKIWQVGLVKREGFWVINDGWKEFACYHSLVDGDFLIFKYDGISEFEVELYCNNGLKKEGRGIEKKPSIHVKEEQETEEDFIGRRPSSGCKQNDSVIDPRITRSQGLFGKSGPKSSETKIVKLGECKGSKAPSSVPREVPRFVINITQYTRYARIPNKFMREHNIEVPKEIKLRNESGKLWPVQINLWDSGYTVLKNGFSEFCRANKVVPKDQCALTFICSKGNLCKVIQVQVVRRGPRT
ncbi:B3 domain-containing protein [Salix suchowensis]|nr:B3 domain-containing protein [Salix suchowensis]